MNQFPANAIPGFQPPPGMVPGMMPHPSMMQQLPPGMAPPGMPGAPPEVLQQQYLHQQQLAMAQAMRQQQLQQQQHAVSVAAANAQAQAAARPKPRKGRPPVLPRNQGDYVKGAMAPPNVPAVRQNEAGNALSQSETEPWADMLDELDPRELAMARFRARQEVMTEIFGPERVQDVPEPVTDPWSGIGITGETLEAKVEALEKSNAELEANFDAELEAWRKRLENPELIEPETV